MVTNKLYELKGITITKDGDTIFLKDVVKDLNGWRNHARNFRNKNTLLLKEIGKLKYPEESSPLSSKEK